MLYHLYLLTLYYAAAPTHFDLSHTPGRAFESIGDQGNCGLCAVYAFTHAYSMRALLARGEDFLPSALQLATCNNFSCHGVTISNFINKVHDLRVPDEARDAGASNHSACNRSASPAVQYRKIIGEAFLKAEIWRNGPVVAPLMLAAAPVLGTGAECSSALDVASDIKLAHLVVVVGYTEHAWIIKNSWGPRWGDHGYARVDARCIVFGVTVSDAPRSPSLLDHALRLDSGFDAVMVDNMHALVEFLSPQAP